MLEGAAVGGFAPGDFLAEESHNVSLGGDFSIQVRIRDEIDKS
jgi:ataxin-3